MKASLPAKAPDAYGRKSETAEHKGEQRCYRHDIACFGKRTSIVGNPRCLRDSRCIGSFRFIGSLRVVGSLRPLFSEGVMPEIGWFSSTREESTGRRGLVKKSVVSLNWPYACGRSRRPSASGEKRPARALQGPHVDENLPISGRSPLLSCHGSSQTRGKRLRGRAGASEPNSAARAKARSTGLRTKVGPGGQSGSRVCAPGASRASDADSARAKSCTRVLCRYSPRLGRRSSE